MPVNRRKASGLRFHGFVLGGKLYEILKGDFTKEELTVQFILVCARKPFPGLPKPEPFKMANPKTSGATRFSFFKEIKINK